MNYVSSIPRSQLSEASQLMVLDSFGHIAKEPPRLVVRSEFHALPALVFVAAAPWDPSTATTLEENAG